MQKLLLLDYRGLDVVRNFQRRLQRPAKFRGNPLPGFREQDCLPVAGDATDHQMRWQANEQIPTGHPLRLRLRARSTKLYSIYFTALEETPVYPQFKGIG